MFNTSVFTKVIMLSVKAVKTAIFPPSAKLVLISRREKEKKITKAVLFLEKKGDSDINTVHGLG